MNNQETIVYDDLKLIFHEPAGLTTIFTRKSKKCEFIYELNTMKGWCDHTTINRIVVTKIIILFVIANSFEVYPRGRNCGRIGYTTLVIFINFAVRQSKQIYSFNVDNRPKRQETFCKLTKNNCFVRHHLKTFSVNFSIQKATVIETRITKVQDSFFKRHLFHAIHKRSVVD